MLKEIRICDECKLECKPNRFEFLVEYNPPARPSEVDTHKYDICGSQCLLVALSHWLDRTNQTANGSYIKTVVTRVVR